MINIYIEGRQIETDADFQLNITYQFADLDDPSKIAGDYSKDFTIKGTQANNAIFGQIWRLDRQTINDALGGSNVSIYFNAAKRAESMIYLNNEVFKRGYVKLNAINTNNGTITYSLVFFSEMLKRVREMMEDLLVDLPFPSDLHHTLNCATIAPVLGGTASGGIWDYLTYVMANNGLYDEFDSAKILTKDTQTGAVSVQDVAGGAELDELAMRQYRSYYQRPALRLGATIQLIADTYGIRLDPTFFNEANPYFARLVMTLPMQGMSKTNYNDYADGIAFTDALLPTMQFKVRSASDVGISKKESIYFAGNGLVFGSGDVGYSPIVKEPAVTGEKHTSLRFRCTLDVTLLHPASNSKGTFEMVSNGKLWLRFRRNGSLPQEVELAFSSLLPVSGNRRRLRYTGFVDLEAQDLPSGEYTYDVYLYGFYHNNIDARIKHTWLDNNWQLQEEYLGVDVTDDAYTLTVSPEYAYVSSESPARSGMIMSKNGFIPTELTVGKLLISYAKLFGLLFHTDREGQLCLSSRNGYFANYSVSDWTDKLDHSKAIDQQPTMYDSQAFVMKYNDGGTFYENYYKGRYNRAYAEQRIETGYEFNEEDTQLFDGLIFQNAVMSNEMTKMEIDGVVITKRDSRILPAFFTKKGALRERSDTKYNLLLDAGVVPIDGTEVRVTDDHPRMLDEEIGGGNYCWLDGPKFNSNYSRSISSYRLYTTLFGDYSTSIGYPRENYAGWQPSVYRPFMTIYSRFWSRYIAERYSPNGRIVTAYFHLTPLEVLRFDFSHFVALGDTLWHVNRVIDFDPTRENTTQVELVRVSDYNAIDEVYRNGQIWEDVEDGEVEQDNGGAE